MNVYAILLESGVIASGQDIRETEIFRRSLELGLIATPEQPDKAACEIPPDAATSETLLHVSGMWCTSCAWLVEHALRSIPGVRSAEVQFVSDIAKVRFCPQYVPPDRLTRCIERLGYKSSEYSGEESTAKSETRDLLLRLGVAAFLWSNIMGFSTILYVGYFEEIARSASHLLPFFLMFLTTPLVFYCAYPILRLAVIGMRARQIRMETLLSLGILAAYGYSTLQAFRGETRVYFDTAAAIVTLVLTGKLIERAAKQKAAKAIAMLYRLMPKKVRLVSSGEERFVSLEALEPGNVFLVKAGERIPADGVIQEGQTHVDEALLTGESNPVEKKQGEPVVCGSLNEGNVIRVRATRVGNDSTLAQIIRLVEQALGTRAPIQLIVDQVSRVFVPAVVMVALLTAGYGVLRNQAAAEIIMRAISVLVIACPCALGLATPLAITAAVGAASQRGILVSDSRVLEAAGSIGAVFLDKTGTVTEGDFRLADVAVCMPVMAGGGHTADATCEREWFLNTGLPLIAAVEACSEHPLGRAVVARAREEGIRVPSAVAAEVHKGKGISGCVDGATVFLGNSALAKRFAGEITDEVRQQSAKYQGRGFTTAYFGWDGEIRGVLAFGDTIKPEAANAVASLKERGYRVYILSGDSCDTTAAVAASVGADGFMAEVSPEGKIRKVEESQARGVRVAMIGDGINDAPALAQADLGVALGTGTDIAMKAAPVVAMSGSLMSVVETFDLAAKTRRVVRQNLFWSFLYNSLGITLAITGVLTPILAAGAMLLSSVSVVLNSMRLSEAPHRAAQ